jgi:hypothetical protein
MTTFSTPRRVASPKASIAFPASVPGPQIVLIDVAVPDVEKLTNDIEDNLLMCLDEIEVVIIAVKSGK